MAVARLGGYKNRRVLWASETFLSSLWSNYEQESQVPGIFMSFSRSVGIVITSFACLLGTWVGADQPTVQTAARATAQAPALLPQQFGGWQMQGSAQTSTDPAAADPTNEAVLKEYRFS